VSIEFPLRQKRTPFGLVSDPKIPVHVRFPQGDRRYYFLLDTGADFSIAPRRLAHQLGMEWAELRASQVIGVEQRGVHARLGLLPIRVGQLDFTVRCFFVDALRTPFVLGRADFLDHLILHIDPSARRIILDDIT
jgi:predicted aspartyl protease